jgi:hypothetical protein
MVAHRFAVNTAEGRPCFEIFVHVADVPSHPHNVPRRCAAFGENRGNVSKDLTRLADKVRRKSAMLIPADQAADEQELAARLDAVRIPFRPRPTGGLQNLVLPRARGQNVDRAI